MDHQAEDAHLGGTAVVELDGELLVDGGLVPLGLGELDLGDLVLAEAVAVLDRTDEEEELYQAGGGDVLDGGQAGTDGGEGDAVSDLTGEADTGGGDNVAEDGKHGDAAVLGLDLAEAVEAGLVGTVQQVQGIVQTQRSLHADLVLVRTVTGPAHGQGAGLHHAAGRGEGGHGGKDGKDRDEAEHL